MKAKIFKFKPVSTVLIILASSMLMFGCNNNGNGGGAAKSTEQLKSELAKEIPGVPKIDEVNKSPINGIYEVVVGRKVFYVTADGKYLIFGNIVDPVSKKSLTEDRTQQLSKIDWNKLPLDLAIKEVNGTGERKLAVFSDPECPYCQMFERQVAPLLTNTTIYTFLFPLPMHQKAKPDAEAIWCSKDRTSVWTNWMRSKMPIPAGKKCDTSGLDKIYAVGTDVVQVEGTPTIILSNGQILPGMLPADQLISQMDQADGVAKGSAK